MSEPATKYAPLLVGRNVYALLEQEKLSGADTLNRELRPYWPSLWRLAARGHYYTTQQPIREAPRTPEHVFRPPIPPMREGGFTLSFARGDSNDFFPGQRAPQHPLGRYPLVAEFRAMLAALDPETPMPDWKGKYFFGFRIERGKEPEFSFRAQRHHVHLVRKGMEGRAGPVPARLGDSGCTARVGRVGARIRLRISVVPQAASRCVAVVVGAPALQARALVPTIPSFIVAF